MPSLFLCDDLNTHLDVFPNESLEIRLGMSRVHTVDEVDGGLVGTEPIFRLRQRAYGVTNLLAVAPLVDVLKGLAFEVSSDLLVVREDLSVFSYHLMGEGNLHPLVR